MMLAALLAAPLSCCVAQPRRDDGDEDDDAEAVIFVLSAHMPDVGPHVDSHALEESEMDWEQAEAPWLQWGVPTVAWLAPFYGATSYGSKGGLCTQALLASLRQRDRGQSFFELLTTMRRVFDRAGLVSAVLTLRSSMKSIPDVRGGSARVGARASAPSCSVARAFPSASELERAPKAVLVGICYEDSPKWKLEGSWNDILDMKEWLLADLGWPEAAVRLVADRADSDALPTRTGILQQLEWLCNEEDNTQPRPWPHVGFGTCRLLHFCGHGTSGDFLPSDWRVAGVLPGSLVAKALVRAGRGREDIAVTCVVDCCDSSNFFSSLAFEYKAT